MKRNISMYSESPPKWLHVLYISFHFTEEPTAIGSLISLTIHFNCDSEFLLHSSATVRQCPYITYDTQPHGERSNGERPETHLLIDLSSSSSPSSSPSLSREPRAILARWNGQYITQSGGGGGHCPAETRV